MHCSIEPEVRWYVLALFYQAPGPAEEGGLAKAEPAAEASQAYVGYMEAYNREHGYRDALFHGPEVH